MERAGTILGLLLLLPILSLHHRAATAATEVKLDRDFLAGVVEKLPPSPFEKKGQYRGTIHSYRLLAIEPKLRRFLAGCQVEGEFKPPASGPISEHVSRSDEHKSGLRKFRFEIKAGVNVEAGPDAMPRFKIDVEEIKRAELEGFAGLLAKLLGKFFDDMVTQIADGRAALLNQKLNAEILKRAAIFKEYGAFCGIDYTADQVTLRFDLTRLRREGIAAYVYPTPGPGTVPLYRFFNKRNGSHDYTTTPGSPDRPGYVAEGIACHVLDREASGTIPLYAWHTRRDRIYTTSPAAGELAPLGFRPDGVAFYAFPREEPGTVPLYRFFDPRLRLHFYTTHPHAEFAK